MTIEVKALSEVEYLDRLKDNLRKAAEQCRQLAHHTLRGFVYDDMRKRLKQIEDDCTSVAYCRDGDARWLNVGLMMEEAHKRAGDWLRKSHTEAQRKRAAPLFLKLADNLDQLYRTIIDLETKATGQLGPILPAVLPAPHRPGKNVQVALPANMRRTNSGLIVPAGVGMNG